MNQELLDNYRKQQFSTRKNFLFRLSIFVLSIFFLLIHFRSPTLLQAYGAPAQQDATSTLTTTISPTPSLTTTIDATLTGTASLTPGLTASVTSSLTSTVLASQSPLPSSTPGLTASVTPSFTIQPIDTQDITLTPANYTATSTYLPLPTLTMIYPKITITAYLMSGYHTADSIQKQRFPLVIRVLARFWPLVLLLLVWGVLIVWFIVVQIKGEKNP